MTSQFWKASMRDRVRNGTYLGIVFGLLVASSDITWIQSIVTSIVGTLPENYQSVKFIDYVLFGLIGGGLGYFVDKF